MKTVDQTHLLNFGCECPNGALHVQFNKQTGNVETLSVTDARPGHAFTDITKTLNSEQLERLKRYARKQYKEQYGHFPEHQPASDN